MATKKLVVRGQLGITGSLESGAGDPVLTRDASSAQIGSVPAIDTSVFISTTLPSGQILVGNGSNIATPRTASGAITIDNLGQTAITGGYILDAHINAAAGIQVSKLSPGSNGQVVKTTGGVVVWGTDEPGHIIENVGTPLTQRANLNISNGLTASDNDPDTDVKLGGPLVNATTIVGTTTNMLTYQVGSLGVTPSNVFMLENPTAAAAGAQQISPPLVMRGRGWKTNATAESQTVDFYQYTLPVQGAANPTGNWILATSINGGGLNNALNVQQDSSFTTLTVGFTGAEINTVGGTNLTVRAGGGTLSLGANGVTGITYTQSTATTAITGSLTATSNIGTTNGQLLATTNANMPSLLLNAVGGSSVYSNNTYTISIQGSSTGANTTAINYGEYRSTHNFTTGNTNQTIFWFQNAVTYTSNHTGTTVRGIYFNPTIAGSQTPSHVYALQTTTGKIGLANYTNGTPVDGDFWFDASKPFARVSGATARLWYGAATVNANEILYSGTSGTGDVITSSNLTFNGSTLGVTGTITASVKIRNLTTSTTNEALYDVANTRDYAGSLNVDYYVAGNASLNTTNIVHNAFKSSANYTLNNAGAIIYGFHHAGGTVTSPSNLSRMVAFYHDGGFVQWASVLSPTQITSDQNDYNPTGWTVGGAPYGASILRVSTDASRNITSLAGGIEGRLAIVTNVGSQNVVLTDDDGATGTAANRFALPASLTLVPDQATLIFYDDTTDRWRAISAAGSGAISGLTTNRIPYATSSTTLGDDSALTWDATNDALTIGDMRIHSFPGSGTNIFMGAGAGNFTLSGATSNIGIGSTALDSLTSGDNNVGIGNNALTAVTTTSNNTAVGSGALAAANSNGNTAIGRGAGAAISTGSGSNTVVGVDALNDMTTGFGNIALGSGAGEGLSTGDKNIIIGYNIGALLTSGSTGQLNIQNIIFGTGNAGETSTLSTGNVGIGVVSPDRRFHVQVDDSNNDLRYAARFTHESSSFATGIGVGLEFEVETSSGNNEVGATLDVITTDVGAGTEDFDLVLKLMAGGSAAAEKFRFTSDGKLGVGGSPTYNLDVTAGSGNVISRIINTGTGNADLLLQRTGGTASAWELYLPSGSTNLVFFANGADRYTFDNAGTATAVDWVATSDQRLKKNIIPYNNATSKVLAIANLVREYDRIDNGAHEVGFIAQELMTVAPEYVSGSDVLAVNYAKMVAPLYCIIKELKDELDRIKKQLL